MNRIKIELKWAIIFSLVSILWMVLEKMFGLHSKYIDYHMYITNLFAIPAIYIMVLALIEKKSKFYKNDFKYVQGLISGILLSTFISFLSPITQWITFCYITPEYFPNIIKRSVELGYYATTELAKENFNIQSYIIQGIIGSLVMGVATSAISMIFIRTKSSKMIFFKRKTNSNKYQKTNQSL